MTTTETEQTRDSVYQGPDETSAGLLMTLEQHVKDYKSLKSQVDAADGDRESALQNYIENSDDKQAVQIRERIKKATEQLRELAEKNVQEVQLSDEDRKKISTELEAHAEKINAAWTSAKKVANLLEIDEEGVLKALETIGNPTKGKRGRPAGSAGSSVPRASVDIVINGGGFTDQPFQTFSAMAMALKCEVKSIVEEYANAAGVDYLEVASVDSPQEFQFQAKEDGPKFTVKTTPKSRKPRSTKAESETAQAESNDDAAGTVQDGPEGEPQF